MAGTAKREEVRKAADDVRLRTLAPMPRVLDRFIYLASMRDYNTGLYYHDGLAARFSPEIASEALADCHRETFQQLIACSLQELVREMEGYLASTHVRNQDFIAAWETLEPYRVAVPLQTDRFAADFLFSNFKLALAILAHRLAPRRGRRVA